MLVVLFFFLDVLKIKVSQSYCMRVCRWTLVRVCVRACILWTYHSTRALSGGLMWLVSGLIITTPPHPTLPSSNPTPPCISLPAWCRASVCCSIVLTWRRSSHFTPCLSPSSLISCFLVFNQTFLIALSYTDKKCHHICRERLRNKQEETENWLKLSNLYEACG